ncbi:MAG TPA: hypothetical protein VMB25_03170 [Bryobacteraceae bacterium]|nr:hypothetical protein [Bryobacteraceae bacterium]
MTIRTRFALPALALAACAMLLVLPVNVHADVIYTYTGQMLGADPGYVFPYTGYSFDGSFTVATALSDPTLTDITSQVTSFSFSVVCQDATGCDADGTDEAFGSSILTFNATSVTTEDFQVQTNSAGAITNWLVELVNDEQHLALSCDESSANPGPTSACTSPGWGNGGGDEIFDGGGTVGIVEWPNNGTWSSVPEPSGTGPFAGGLFGLIVMGVTLRRRSLSPGRKTDLPLTAQDSPSK